MCDVCWQASLHVISQVSQCSLVTGSRRTQRYPSLHYRLALPERVCELLVSAAPHVYMSLPHNRHERRHPPCGKVRHRGRTEMSARSRRTFGWLLHAGRHATGRHETGSCMHPATPQSTCHLGQLPKGRWQNRGRPEAYKTNADRRTRASKQLRERGCNHRAHRTVAIQPSRPGPAL
jgi:hypothetical protein